MDKISVIIPTKNRLQDAARCLESISIQTLPPKEVIIVDSSDTDALKSELGKFPLDIRYIRSRPGLTHQRNVGIENSSGDIVIFLDDDVLLDKNYIKEIARVFDEKGEDSIGGVTGEIIYGPRQEKATQKIRRMAGHAFDSLFLLHRYGSGRFQLSGFPTMVKDGSVSRITKVEFLRGCNMAFKRKMIGAFKFDEKLSGYGCGEDDDIAYRISRKHQNYYTPFAKIVLNDFSSSTGGGDYSLMKSKIENHYYLFKKNLPDDFKHKAAFCWSVAGMLVREAMTAVRKRSSGGLKGLASGLRKITA